MCENKASMITFDEKDAFYSTSSIFQALNFGFAKNTVFFAVWPFYFAEC